METESKNSLTNANVSTKETYFQETNNKNFPQPIEHTGLYLRRDEDKGFFITCGNFIIYGPNENLERTKNEVLLPSLPTVVNLIGAMMETAEEYKKTLTLQKSKKTREENLEKKRKAQENS